MAVALAARVFDTQANQSFDATFERFPVRLGRNQLNDLPIDRPYVSQFHASFDVRDGRIFLRDLGSTNGTIYAGQRLQRDTPVDVTLQPDFEESVFIRTVVDMHGEHVEDPHYPNYLPYKNCYGLGCLGAGNHQVLLDLNGPVPRLIDFFFYPCIEYDECVEIGVSFTEWIDGHLGFGPDRSYYDFVRFGDEAS